MGCRSAAVDSYSGKLECTVWCGGVSPLFHEIVEMSCCSGDESDVSDFVAATSSGDGPDDDRVVGVSDVDVSRVSDGTVWVWDRTRAVGNYDLVLIVFPLGWTSDVAVSGGTISCYEL